MSKGLTNTITIKTIEIYDKEIPHELNITKNLSLKLRTTQQTRYMEFIEVFMTFPWGTLSFFSTTIFMTRICKLDYNFAASPPLYPDKD